MNEKTTRLVLIALLAALCCVATMVLPIPTPTGGYLNAGDSLTLPKPLTLQLHTQRWL